MKLKTIKQWSGGIPEALLTFVVEIVLYRSNTGCTGIWLHTAISLRPGKFCHKVDIYDFLNARSPSAFRRKRKRCRLFRRPGWNATHSSGINSVVNNCLRRKAVISLRLQQARYQSLRLPVAVCCLVGTCR